MNTENNICNKVSLITGASQRVGAQIARTLHYHGMRVMIHFWQSETAALALADELNKNRRESADVVQGDLRQIETHAVIEQKILQRFGQLDALINNASSFYATPLASTKSTQFDDLIGTNLKAPYFLTQSLSPTLIENNGSVVNITDIYAQRPLIQYSVYCAAKAGLGALTKALALELAPHVRVNAIAPGAILWASGDTNVAQQASILSRTPLGRLGDPRDIANTVLYLLRDAPFVTGQILNIDGGRSLMP